MSEWDRLPLELQVLILSQLAPWDRNRAGRVCREWSHVIRSHRQLCARVFCFADTNWMNPVKLQKSLASLPPGSGLCCLKLLGLRGDKIEQTLKILTASSVVLRCLQASGSYGEFSTVDSAVLKKQFAKLIRSQPHLEKLVVGPFLEEFKFSHNFSYRLTSPGFDNLAPMDAIQQLQFLRVLVLSTRSIYSVSKIPVTVLGRLDLFAVCYASKYTNWGLPKEVHRHMRECAPSLLPREYFDEKNDVRFFLWCREDPEEACNVEFVKNALQACEIKSSLKFSPFHEI